MQATVAAARLQTEDLDLMRSSKASFLKIMGVEVVDTTKNFDSPAEAITQRITDLEAKVKE